MCTNFPTLKFYSMVLELMTGHTLPFPWKLASCCIIQISFGFEMPGWGTDLLRVLFLVRASAVRLRLRPFKQVDKVQPESQSKAHEEHRDIVMPTHIPVAL